MSQRNTHMSVDELESGLFRFNKRQFRPEWGQIEKQKRFGTWEVIFFRYYMESEGVYQLEE